MLLLRLMGGLGNQMFQYAFGYSLSRRLNTELVIDTSLIRGNSEEGSIQRSLDLDIFDIDLVLADKKMIERFNGPVNGSLLERLIYKLRTNIGRTSLVLEKDRRFHKEYLDLKDNSCLVGGFQSPNYFIEYEKDIRKIFKISNLHLNSTIYKQTLEQISSIEDSVSLHVRRTDYVKQERYRDIFGELGLSYYRTALTKLIEKLGHDDIKVFVFSDDIDWCRENLIDLHPDIHLVDQEYGKRGMAADLDLMSRCKHHIISNSTFAWWGAWLAEEGLVIAPSYWVSAKYLTNYKIHASDILPNSWITIEHGTGN